MVLITNIESMVEAGIALIDRHMLFAASTEFIVESIIGEMLITACATLASRGTCGASLNWDHRQVNDSLAMAVTALAIIAIVVRLAILLLFHLKLGNGCRSQACKHSHLLCSQSVVIDCRCLELLCGSRRD